MRHVFIINPRAGKRDQTARIYEMANHLRSAHGLDCTCMLTDRPGGATEMARRLAEEGRGVVLALHDLCLALAAADDVAVLGEGRLLALGGPEEIYRSGILERVMGVRLDRTAGPGGWRYFCELPEEG